MNPELIALGIQAALAILRQIDLYSREPATSPEALLEAHAAVLRFMDAVALEVEKRRSPR